MQLQNVLYLLFSAGVFFLMMRVGCGAHVMGHGHSHGSTASPNGHGAADTAATAVPEHITDPVCGMSIPTATSKTSVYAGTVYYFCSQDCRGKFEDSPANYARTAASHTPERHHGC